MLFDPKILNANTIHEILDLVYRFGALMKTYSTMVALYFSQVTRDWRVLPVVQAKSGWVYDYYPRVADKSKYMLTKIVIG